MASRYWLLVLILCGANGFPLKCPPPSQRPMRAKVLCSNPATYLCLHDDIKDGFSENCSRVTVEQPGKVTTLNYQGNFDNKPCSTKLYQPRRIRYWTNVSTDCIYQKSSCTEEGQVEYDDGGVQSDRTCTCDYTRGYTFVNTPRNPCFCKPSREDCSCYMKTYLNDGIIRSNDMNCAFPFNETAGHVLPRGMHSDLSLVPTKHHDDTRKNPTNIRHEIHLAFIRKIDKQKILLTGLVIVTCIILVILTTLLYYATIEKTYGCYNLKRLTNKYLIKAFVIRPFEKSLECFEGNSFSLECEISVGTVRCFKGLTDITDRYRINRKKSGFHYELYISAMKRGDSDTYSIRTESGSILTETVLRCKNTIVKIENGKLKTEVYRKETDKHMFVHMKSNDPNHIKRSIPYGRCIRIKRICTYNSDYIKNKLKLRQELRKRGYSGKYIDKEFEKVDRIDRQELLKYKIKKNKQTNRVPLVQQTTSRYT